MDAKKEVDKFFEKQKEASEIKSMVEQMNAFVELVEYLENVFTGFYKAGFKEGLKKINIDNIN